MHGVTQSFKIVSIYLFLVFLGLCCFAQAFSSCGEWGYFSLWCMDFSLWWLLLLWSTGSVVVVCRLSCSMACRIFPDQGSTCVPSIGRWILIHCTTKQALLFNIGQINKVLLYSTGNYIQYLMIKHNGKEYEAIYVTESFCYKQKLTQHCKSTILQLKNKQKKNDSKHCLCSRHHSKSLTY